MNQDVASGPNPDRLCLTIPDHELLCLIGRGSYGEIWLARSVMGAYRAVKVVYRSSFKDDRPFERELSGIRKYEPISRSHEKFIDILQIGINKEHGYFYYVMELGDDCVHGQKINPETYEPKTLTRALNGGGKLSFAECLDLGLSLSQALVELHKHGLVHRDIKPSNIIFVNGVAKLADIGLVADMSEARSFVGTEGYIPPEGPGTPEADVFSLGKVLYEASTGKDRLQFPELPTMLGSSAEQDNLLELNEVILQACQPNRDQRYGSAWEMYSDLLVIADGDSVKRLRFLERRFAQFKKIAAVAAVVVAVGAAVFYHFYRERQNAREARQRQIGANVEHGLQAIDSWDLTTALPSFGNVIALDHGDKAQESTHRFMFANVLARCPKLVKVLAAHGEVQTAQFSPDGKKILICDGRARIFDAASDARPTQEAAFGTNVFRATYSPDGSLVATIESSNVNIWPVTGGAAATTLPHDCEVASACFNPEGSRIVTGCTNGSVQIWNVQSAALIRRWQGHTNRVECVAFSANGSNIVTTSYDRMARIWSAQGSPMGGPIECSMAVMHGSFSPDGIQLVIADYNHDAYVRDVSNTNDYHFRTRLHHGDAVYDAQFSPDSRFILTASSDHTVRIWSAETYAPRYPISILRHFDRVRCASFSADSRRIVTGCADGTVCIWDLAGADILPKLALGRYTPEGTGFVTWTNGTAELMDSASGAGLARLRDLAGNSELIQYTKNSHLLLSSTTNTGDPGRTFSIWNCEQGNLVSSIHVTNSLASAAINDTGKRLVICAGREARIWNLPTGTDPLRATNEAKITSAFFNRDGTRLVLAAGKSVRICDALTGRDIVSPLKHDAPVLRVEFSPDETRLATSCEDFSVKLWDSRTGRPLLTPFKHADAILWTCFSPNGKRLVAACNDHSATVWSTENAHPICPPLLHDGPVNQVTFSSDGKWIVTASADSMARVWDAETGEPLSPPLEHFMPVKSAFFLPGDRRITALTSDGQTWVWKLPVENRPLRDILSHAQLLAGQPLGSSGLLPEKPAALWTRLHTEYPNLFQVTTNEIAAWEEYSARDSTRHHYWRGAVSHWQHRLEFDPSDSRIRTALHRAELMLRAYSR